MHSPEWIRKNGGQPNTITDKPYPDPEAFNAWLLSMIGTPENAGIVILISRTLEVCILSTAQQLSFRGYDVYVLKEASNIYDLADVSSLIRYNIDYKDILFNTSHREFVKLINWGKFKVIIETDLLEKEKYDLSELV